MSSFCVIDDAHEICDEMDTFIQELPLGEIRAYFDQIHSRLLDVLRRAKQYAEDLTTEKEEAENGETNWESKYDKESDRADDLDTKLEELKEELETLKEEAKEREEEEKKEAEATWRDHPDPYGLHGIGGGE